MRSVLVILLILLGGVGSAWAEKARAKDGARLMSRAGERGKVLFKLKEGQVMRILKKDGRWYKVNVKGRTGWIMRTRVEMVEEKIARNTRRRPFVDGRSTKRDLTGGEAPSDRVGADAAETDDPEPRGKKPDDDDDDDDKPKKPKKPKKPVVDDDDDDDDDDDGDTSGDEPTITDDEGDEITDDRPRARLKKKATIYADPDEDGDEAEWTAKPGTMLFINKRKGKFTEVENEETDIGYVLTSALEEIEDEGGGGRPSERQIDARARLGVTIIQQGLRSDGMNGLPDNYNLNTSAATVALGGAYLRPYGKKSVIGGEANLDIARAIPGIKAPNNQTTGITLYHLNARGMFGYDLGRKSGMMVFARLGLRYQSYQVSNVGDLNKNTAKLPSEIITAPTIGAALAIPRLTDKVGLRFNLDAMIAGASLKQTKDLEDGTKTSAKGIVGGIGFSYRWKPNMDIQAGYELNLTKYDFGTPLMTSMRGHTGTGAVKRTDVFHGVTAGFARAF